jgi:hypothetical protein
LHILLQGVGMHSCRHSTLHLLLQMLEHSQKLIPLRWLLLAVLTVLRVRPLQTTCLQCCCYPGLQHGPAYCHCLLQLCTNLLALPLLLLLLLRSRMLITILPC